MGQVPGSSIRCQVVPLLRCHLTLVVFFVSLHLLSPGLFHRPRDARTDLVRRPTKIMEADLSPPSAPPPTNALSSLPLTVPITLPASHEPSAPQLEPLPMATSVLSSSASDVTLAPSSPSSPSFPCHRVHFDLTCVLIPEATEPPAIRLTAKTYAIPAWARLGRPSSYPEPSKITLKLPRLVLCLSGWEPRSS